ncbi:hypothetical protein NLJ89_g759 [Agrocybe chaxingu]|uniref:Uncharacterized protein n=1 Tax=Agrocybe chaxingu TaxID=84603 RepID=A0A9W8N1E5_9AGAR|nr:hypothetical protein NLJ89_g759 [Agrocybe chaxingu]
MNYEYNEFYTPEVAQWLADNAAMNSLHPTAVPLPRQACLSQSSALAQAQSRESSLRVSRHHGTTPHSHHFHPYPMGSRPRSLLHPSPTALWVGGQRGFEYSFPQSFCPQGHQSIAPTAGVHAGPSTIHAGGSSLPSLSGHPNRSNPAFSNGDSSSARLCASSRAVGPSMLRLDMQYPHPSWTPPIQPAPRHNIQNSSRSVDGSFGSRQSSASSSQVPSWREIEPSPTTALADRRNSSGLPQIFAPRPTQAYKSNTPRFSGSSEGDFSEAGPSSRPLESLRQPDSVAADGRSSSSGPPPDVQGASTEELVQPSAVEKDTGVSTEQAWFSPEVFAENHTWNIRCRLARNSKTRGLFDKTGTALDPAIDRDVDCGSTFDDPAAFVQHLEFQHRVTNAKHGQKGLSRCAWAGCNSELGVGSYHRHVAEKHAMHWRCPYKECTGRHIRKGVNRTIGGYVQSYARINLLENHIRSHHSGDDLATMKAAYGDGWKLAYAVLTPQIGGVTGTA